MGYAVDKTIWMFWTISNESTTPQLTSLMHTMPNMGFLVKETQMGNQVVKLWITVQLLLMQEISTSGKNTLNEKTHLNLERHLSEPKEDEDLRFDILHYRKVNIGGISILSIKWYYNGMMGHFLMRSICKINWSIDTNARLLV